jgi:4-hydroxyphenylpyruvate dioxygenase
MRTSIATVCLSGSLSEKLHAASAAGFDGVELFEPDLVAAPESPEEVVALAARLGLSLDLYQPFRDAEGVTEEEFARVLRRASAKFQLMQRLGIGTMLVCSNVATATVDDDEVSAGQLRRLGELAAQHGVRIAYEALAWGTYVDDYRRSWRIVELADHDAVGLCLDSFHILSRGHDPAAIEQIPGAKVFYLQLADAPALTMDVLSWSRHHRLFPGEGAFDLGAFVGHVFRTGYDGPLSLEVFNDVFRQTDVERTARQARRSLTWLEDLVAGQGVWTAVPDPPARLPTVSQPAGLDFVEVRAEDTGDVDVLLGQLGFTFRGRHRSKDARLWTEGPARVVCNEQHAREDAPRLAGVGFEVADPSASAARARTLRAAAVYRRTLATEQDLPSFRAPDGTEVFFGSIAAEGEDAPWVPEFEGGHDPRGSLLTGIDHVNLAEPWQCFDESVLFYSSVLGLTPTPGQEVPSLRGLVRSQVLRSDSGACRLALNVAPLAWDRYPGFPQHVAFATEDVVGMATRARERGLEPLAIPKNYYDDLRARFDLSSAEVETMAELGLLYDRDATGDFTHFYTSTIGNIFFEVVQRRGAYEGYGAPNAGVRLAVQHRQASSTLSSGPTVLP